MPLLLYAAASLFIHALSPGKYAGMIFFILFLIVSRRAADLGLEHDLWRFGAAPPLPYSELNGFGHYARRFMVHAALDGARAAAGDAGRRRSGAGSPRRHGSAFACWRGPV